MKRRFNSEQDVEIAVFYGAGETLAQIAIRYESSVSAVQKSLIRSGVERRGFSNLRSTPLTGSQESEILAAISRDEPVNRICQQFHIGAKRLRAIANDAGITISKGPRKGERHPWWKGGKASGGGGYVSAWVSDNHPRAGMRNHKGRIPEHRLVMAEHLGRDLHPLETVHHINGRKDDNRMENLQLMLGNHGRRMAYQCLSCGSMSVAAVALPSGN